MKIVQINTTVNSGSTGRIAEDIGRLLIAKGHKSIIAFGRGNRPSESQLIKTGNRLDQGLHVLMTRLFDLHGYGSRIATIRLIRELEIFQPDLVHLHNIHGYYLNIHFLFKYLEDSKIPVVWTLHDCWAFTGHCSYFDRVACLKWQSQCLKCPSTHFYPKSWLIDNSKNNFRIKKALFLGIENLTLVSPSEWLAKHLKDSFFKNSSIKVINNGIDLDLFKPGDPNIARFKYKINGKNTILGVANVWDKRKGLDDFLKLRTLLNSDFQIVLVGLNSKQISNLPEGIVGISRTDNINDLASLFSLSDVFVNPTYVDNFPTVNLEALACGTPVITYDTGGSPESVSDKTGTIVSKGDINGIFMAISKILSIGKENYSFACRERALRLYDKRNKIEEYLYLYETQMFNSKKSIQ